VSNLVTSRGDLGGREGDFCEPRGKARRGGLKLIVRSGGFPREKFLPVVFKGECRKNVWGRFKSCAGQRSPLNQNKTQKPSRFPSQGRRVGVCRSFKSDLSVSQREGGKDGGYGSFVPLRSGEGS